METPSISDAPAGPQPDPVGVAEALLSEHGDEEQRAASSTERVRRYRERKRQASEQEPETDSISVTPDEIEEAASMAGAVWDLAVVPMAAGRVRELDEAQSRRLGKAMAPLVKRYLPMLGRWQYEIAAGMCIVSLVRETWRDNEEFAAWQAAQREKRESADA